MSAQSAANSTTRPALLDRLGLPRPLIWGFVGLLLFMVGDGVESGYIAPFLASNGAGTETTAAVIITAYGLIVTLGSWLAGALSDILGPRKVMLLGLVIWAVFEVLFLAVAVPSQNLTLILLTYGIRGFGYPLFAYGFLVWILAGSPANRLGSAVGWFYFAFTGGLPTLGSLLASGTEPIIGEYMTLWVSLVTVIAGGAICLWGFATQREATDWRLPALRPARASLTVFPSRLRFLGSAWAASYVSSTPHPSSGSWSSYPQSSARSLDSAPPVGCS